MPLTVGILTFNSVDVVGAAVGSVSGASEIIVCDGGSTDGTRELVADVGCRLIDQDAAYQDERGRLIDIAGVREQVVRAATNDWILMLDSDELATPELMDEVHGVVAEPERTAGAYRVPRLFVLDGQIIRSAMVYPSFQTRLVHRAALVGYRGLVHDVPELVPGEEIGELEHAQLVPQPPFPELWRKWHAYMRLEEVKKAGLERHAWYEQVCKPGLRAARWLTYRYVTVLRSGIRPRLPARYELGRVAYELGVVMYTGRRFIGLGDPDLEHAWDAADRRSRTARL